MHALRFPTFSFLALATLLLAGGASVALAKGADTLVEVRIIPLEIGHIPRGAQRVPLLRLLLRTPCQSNAGAGDIEVQEIEVRRIGLGDPSGIQSVYLLSGYKRLSRSVALSSADQMARLRPRRLLIPACQEVLVDVAVDFREDVSIGNVYSFEVPLPENIVLHNARAVGEFPLRNTSVIRTPSLRSDGITRVRGAWRSGLPLAARGSRVTPRPAGAVTVTFLPLQGTIHPIRTETLARLRIAADEESHQMLEAITLTNEGTAQGDELRSLFLTRRDGSPLTDVAPSLEHRKVTLRFTPPFLLERGQEVLFELKGQAWRRVKTVEFTLEEPSDLVVVPVSGRK